MGAVHWIGIQINEYSMQIHCFKKNNSIWTELYF